MPTLLITTALAVSVVTSDIISNTFTADNDVNLTGLELVC